MKELMNSPLFGVLISLVAFEIGCLIYAKTKISLFNPLFIGILLVVGFLLIFHIDLSVYNKGAQLISFFLGPATVILAVPLYKKIELLKKHSVPIITGITVGSIFGIFTIILLSKIFGLDHELIASMIPKSVTVPIGIEVSKQLGGIPAVTTVAIILTGIIGSIIGPGLCKLFKIDNEVAVGIAIGTASHAVGTTKAIEMGETHGAMSGLAIGIAGLVTVVTGPIIYKILSMCIHF